MYKGEIIDAHMHLWDLKEGDYPWLKKEDPFIRDLIGDYKKIRKDFLIDDYLALIKPHLVKKSVHIEANAAPKQGLHETQWLQKIADTYGFPHGIVVYADLGSNDLEEVLKDQLQYPNVRGVRQILYRPEDAESVDLLKEYKWQRGLKLVGKYELSFELALFSHQLIDATKVVREYDDVRFVIDHFGWPIDLTPEGFEIWKNRLAVIAGQPNVYFKMSGMGQVFKQVSRERVAPYLQTAFELFGPDRLFFGSNHPPDSLFGSYGEILDVQREVFSSFEEKVQEKIFFKNAKDFYQI